MTSVLAEAQSSNGLALDAAKRKAAVLDPTIDHKPPAHPRLLEPSPQLWLGPVAARDDEITVCPYKMTHPVAVALAGASSRSIGFGAKRYGVKCALVEDHVPAAVLGAVEDGFEGAVKDVPLSEFYVLAVFAGRANLPGEGDRFGAVVHAEKAAGPGSSFLLFFVVFFVFIIALQPVPQGEEQRAVPTAQIKERGVRAT